MKLPLPSKFATGNFSLVVLLFFILGAPFYWMGLLYLLTYLWSPIVFYSMLRLHRSRAKHHRILNPPSIAQSLYEIRVNQTRIDSRLDDIEFQITLGKSEGG